jgi:predicted nucleic acid-binding protein
VHLHLPSVTVTLGSVTERSGDVWRKSDLAVPPREARTRHDAYKALGEGNQQLAEEARTAEAVGLPMIVLGELWFGFMNGNKLRQSAATLERFLAIPRVRVLELDRQTTRVFGEIATVLRQAGIAIQQNDIWIAALCKQHGFVLATRNRGFQRVLGLEVIEFTVHVPETRGSR